MGKVALSALFAVTAVLLTMHGANAATGLNKKIWQCDEGPLHFLGHGKVLFENNTYKIVDISGDLVGRWIVSLSEPRVNSATNEVEDYFR